MARNNPRKPNQPKEFEEKVIKISRVSKKTKGGNQIGFSALVVVGDRKGKVGVGLGKASDVLSAIQKGIKKAKQKLIKVPLDGTTIPFSVTVKRGAGKVMLKPASKGTGVIAGGPVRAVVEAAGVRDVVAKILGSENQTSSVHATFKALKHIADLVKIKDIKLRSIADIEKEEREKMAAIQEEAKKKAQAPKKTDKKIEKKTEQKTEQKSKTSEKKVTVKKAKKSVKKEKSKK
jgi:small subunit ribosomal protein S5